jgi:hypothetical protein
LTEPKSRTEVWGCLNESTPAWFALGGAAAMLVGGVLSSARLSLALELDSASSSTATIRRRATQES